MDLRKAGCIAIYRDPADLLTRFEPSLLFLEWPCLRRSVPGPLLISVGFAAVAALVCALALRRRRADKACE